MDRVESIRRSSTIAVREEPVAPVVAASGACHVRAGQFAVVSSERLQVMGIV